MACSDIYILITSVSGLAVEYWPYARCVKTKLCCIQIWCGFDRASSL